MTIDEIRDLQRISRDGGLSQLGLWIQATEDGDTEMADMVMSVMGEQTNCGTRDDRGTPMAGDVTPGHSAMLLRRIDLREKG
tara:strand:- start:480 stop:725 length:246 start_codon:yes stop_codon:yes gene_type:complete